MEPLVTKLHELRRLETPELRLAKIDEMLNIVHTRSDIAGWFVEGGSGSLSQLSGYGEDI